MAKASWNLYLYVAAHLDAGDAFVKAARENLEEMMQSGSSAGRANLVGQLDQSETQPTVRFFFPERKPHRKPPWLGECVQELRPNADTTKPAALCDFLEWGAGKYPARKHILVLNGHGLGVGNLFDFRGRYLSVADLAKAIEATTQRFPNWKLDILGMDSCLMAMAEVAYELKGCADTFIASQSEMVLQGWNYRQLAGNLKAGMGPKDVAKRILLRYRQSPYAQRDRYGTTISALNLGAAAGTLLKNAFAQLVTAMLPALQKGNEKQRDLIEDCRGNAKHFIRHTFSGNGNRVRNMDHGFVDLRSFCSNLRRKAAPRTRLRAGCDEVLRALNGFVIRSRTALGKKITRAGTNGVSIYFPNPNKVGANLWIWENSKYKDLKFVTETGWGGFLERYLGMGSSASVVRLQRRVKARIASVRKEMEYLQERCGTPVQPRDMDWHLGPDSPRTGPDSPKTGPDSPRTVAEVSLGIQEVLRILEEQSEMISKVDEKVGNRGRN